MVRKAVRTFTQVMRDFERVDKKEEQVKAYFEPLDRDVQEEASSSGVSPALHVSVKERHRYIDVLDWNDDISTIINIDKFDGGARQASGKRRAASAGVRGVSANARALAAALQTAVDAANRPMSTGPGEGATFSSRLVDQFLARSLSTVPRAEVNNNTTANGTPHTSVAARPSTAPAAGRARARSVSAAGAVRFADNATDDAAGPAGHRPSRLAASGDGAGPQPAPVPLLAPDALLMYFGHTGARPRRRPASAMPHSTWSPAGGPDINRAAAPSTAAAGPGSRPRPASARPASATANAYATSPYAASSSSRLPASRARPASAVATSYAWGAHSAATAQLPIANGMLTAGVRRPMSASVAVRSTTTPSLEQCQGGPWAGPGGPQGGAPLQARQSQGERGLQQRLGLDVRQLQQCKPKSGPSNGIVAKDPAAGGLRLQRPQSASEQASAPGTPGALQRWRPLSAAPAGSAAPSLPGNSATRAPLLASGYSYGAEAVQREAAAMGSGGITPRVPLPGEATQAAIAEVSTASLESSARSASSGPGGAADINMARRRASALQAARKALWGRIADTAGLHPADVQNPNPDMGDPAASDLARYLAQQADGSGAGLRGLGGSSSGYSGSPTPPTRSALRTPSPDPGQYSAVAAAAAYAAGFGSSNAAARHVATSIGLNVHGVVQPHHLHLRLADLPTHHEADEHDEEEVGHGFGAHDGNGDGGGGGGGAALGRTKSFVSRTPGIESAGMVLRSPSFRQSASKRVQWQASVLSPRRPDPAEPSDAGPGGLLHASPDPRAAAQSAPIGKPPLPRTAGGGGVAGGTPRLGGRVRRGVRVADLPSVEISTAAGSLDRRHMPSSPVPGQAPGRSVRLSLGGSFGHSSHSGDGLDGEAEAAGVLDAAACDDILDDDGELVSAPVEEFMSKDFYNLTARVDVPASAEDDSLEGWLFNVYITHIIDARHARRRCIALGTIVDPDGQLLVPLSHEEAAAAAAAATTASGGPALAVQQPLESLTHLINPVDHLPWIHEPSELFGHWIRLEAFALVPQAVKVLDSLTWMGRLDSEQPHAPNLSKIQLLEDSRAGGWGGTGGRRSVRTSEASPGRSTGRVSDAGRLQGRS